MSLGRRLERLEGRHGRRPDTMTTAQLEQQQREHEHLDREIERLLTEIEAREGPGAAERFLAEFEAQDAARNRGLGT